LRVSAAGAAVVVSCRVSVRSMIAAHTLSGTSTPAWRAARRPSAAYCVFERSGLLGAVVQIAKSFSCTFG
jgi:hypothetical protein